MFERLYWEVHERFTSRLRVFNSFLHTRSLQIAKLVSRTTCVLGCCALLKVLHATLMSCASLEVEFGCRRMYTKLLAFRFLASHHTKTQTTYKMMVKILMCAWLLCCFQKTTGLADASSLRVAPRWDPSTAGPIKS